MILAALLLGGPGAGPGRSQDLAESAAEARLALAGLDSLLAAGALAPALELARDRLERFGADPLYGWQFSDRLGLALLRSGRAEEALPLLAQAAQWAPGEADVHRNLASALVELGRRGRALAEYAQAVELAPDRWELHLEYAQVLLDYDDTRRAEVELALAERLCAGCPELRSARARLLLATGRWDAAIAPLQELLAEAPTAAGRRSLVQALQGAQRDSLLLDLWDRWPAADLPADELRLLVQAEGRRGASRRSLAFARTLPGGDLAVDTPPAVRDDDVFWGLVAGNLLAGGHFAAGLAVIDRAVALAPDNAVYRNNRVVLLQRLGREDEARLEWERVLALRRDLEPQEKP